MYFAKDAAYSHIYASTGMAGDRNCVTDPDPDLGPLAHDEREMMQASLVLGRAVVMDRDKVEPSDADHLPPGWQTKTHEGRPYYIDPQKKSHWERPAYSFRQACSWHAPCLLHAR